MSIADTYAKIITEKLIRDLLSEGEVPLAGTVINNFNDFAEANDLSKPLFIADNYKVEWREPSSVSKWNNCNTAIRQDLDVLYKHLFQISDIGLQNFERWRTEASLLEKRLDALSSRISTLLLVSKDTAGYLNFMQDDFIDTAQINMNETSAFVNLNQNLVTLGTSSRGATKIDTSNLTSKDIRFAVLSKNQWNSNTENRDHPLTNIVDATNNSWQVAVHMDRSGPVTVEIKIDFGEEIEISRIDIDLHQASTSTATDIMPMLSLDGSSFSQLATSVFRRSVVDKATFLFPVATARYVKFIMTKKGSDSTVGTKATYEFGIDEISFYNEGFTEDETATLVSLPLSIEDIYGDTQEFSKLVLEVCEDVPENTSIDYSVAASTTYETTLSNLNFVAIDPLNRVDGTHPKVLDFGDMTEVSLSGVWFSFNETASSGVFQSPAQSYNLITGTSAGSAVISSGQASAMRYSCLNDNEGLLSHALASGVSMASDTLELWRNLGHQGYNDSVRVRNVRTGWGYEAPYYYTTIFVSNKAGTSVDFGSKPVIIDSASTTGRATLGYGRHTVGAHEDNWQEIEFGATNVADLKSKDSLYPYNHRYLVEGYIYGSSWTEEEIYKGFDILAEYFMRQVSVFDMMYNVPEGSYEYFAIDTELSDPSALLDGVATPKGLTDVFFIKTDMSNPDFVNEEFLLKFRTIDSQMRYVTLKAELTTTDSEVTPHLDSYRIKVSS